MDSTVITATAWYGRFLETIQKLPLSERLCAAAVAGRFREWTRALTDAVVSTSTSFGWQSVAMGHPASFMPAIRRKTHQEYLTLDAMSFAADDCQQPPEGFRYPFPVAVFELENKRKPKRIAYSLWKMIMVRANLRILFCYSTNREEGGRLVREIAGALLPGLPPTELASLAPGLLLVVGTRGRADSFPYGFFQEWTLDGQSGQLRRP